MKIKLILLLLLVFISNTTEQIQCSQSESSCKPAQPLASIKLDKQLFFSVENNTNSIPTHIKEHFTKLSFSDLAQQHIKAGTHFIIAHTKESKSYYVAHEFNKHLFGKNYLNPESNRYTTNYLAFKYDPKSEKPILNQISYYISSVKDNKLSFVYLCSDFDLHMNLDSKDTFKRIFIENMTVKEISEINLPNLSINNQITLGKKFYENKDYKTAQKLLEPTMDFDLKESSKEFTIAIALLGDIYFKNNDYIKADELFIKALESPHLSSHRAKYILNKLIVMHFNGKLKITKNYALVVHFIKQRHQIESISIDWNQILFIQKTMSAQKYNDLSDAILDLIIKDKKIDTQVRLIAYFRRGIDLYNVKNYTGAIILFQHVLNRIYENIKPEVHNNLRIEAEFYLGLTYHKRNLENDLDTARIYFENAVLTACNNKEFKDLKESCYQYLKQIDERTGWIVVKRKR
ncbi:MAG: hypothetical protein P4L22_03930 [Candidatus Babeliales bacterium]|nr:hypothetical protein [Candidatus Babeliales bacterium]